MGTTNSQWLTILLTVAFTSSSSLAFWGSGSKTTLPTLPPATEHPFVRCPDRACKWVPNATFSCPAAGCTEISVELGDDVEEIYLQDNQISIIPRLGYPNLRLLDLADNNISKIVDYAFEGCCDEMKTLLLSKNKLTNLDSNSLFGLDSLKYLYLQQNELTEIPDVISSVHTRTLERLDLSSNKITKISNFIFSNLDDLKFLHLHRNRISLILSGAFYGLSKLEWLELMDNNITILHEDMFDDLKSLIHLDLNFNNVTTIETGAFNGLKNLKRLSMAHNLLTSLNAGMFEGLENLGELYMGYNYIQSIDEGVLPQNIIKLSLVYSHQLRKLENGSLAGLYNLNEVYINSCHNLQEIEVGAFTGDTAIEALDLSNNHLQTLPEELVIWKQLVYVDLSGNPWDCDCHLEWMLEVNMKRVSRDMIRCETPLSTRGKFLSQLSYDEFRCGDDYHVSFRTALATALVLFFTFLVVMTLVLFIYKCRHKVFPCFYSATVGKYRAMYNTVDNDDDSGVQFEKKPPTNGIHTGTTV